MTPQLPVIQAVSPSESAVGDVGSTVQFAARVTGQPTRYFWSFGTGATPSTSSDPSPRIALGPQGSYQGGLIVWSSEGASEIFRFSYWVGPPRIDGIAADGCAPGEPTRIDEDGHFSASVEGYPTQYEWEFGANTNPTTSNEMAPVVKFTDHSIGTARLVVGNSIGLSVPATAQYTPLESVGRITGVTPTGTVGYVGQVVRFTATLKGYVSHVGWNFGAGVYQPNGDYGTMEVALNVPGTWTATVSANGYPNQPDACPFQFTYAVLPRPTNAWSEQDLPQGTWLAGLTVVNDHPWVFYFLNSDKTLYLQRALSAAPLTSGDWAQSTVLGGEPSLVYPTDAIPIGQSAGFIGSRTDGNVVSLDWVQTTQPAPTGPADWEQVEVDSSDQTSVLSAQALELPQGPCVAYRYPSPTTFETLKVAIATRQRPLSQDDWVRYPLPDPTGIGDRVGLLLAPSGNPVIVHLHDPRIRAEWANSILPLSADDWTSSDCNAAYNPVYIDAVFAGNRLVTVADEESFDGASLVLGIAKTAQPDSDWLTQYFALDSQNAFDIAAVDDIPYVVWNGPLGLELSSGANLDDPNTWLHEAIALRLTPGTGEVRYFFRPTTVKTSERIYIATTDWLRYANGQHVDLFSLPR